MGEERIVRTTILRSKVNEEEKEGQRAAINSFLSLKGRSGDQQCPTLLGGMSKKVVNIIKLQLNQEEQQQKRKLAIQQELTFEWQEQGSNTQIGPIVLKAINSECDAENAAEIEEGAESPRNRRDDPMMHSGRLQNTNDLQIEDLNDNVPGEIALPGVFRFYDY